MIEHSSEEYKPLFSGDEGPTARSTLEYDESPDRDDDQVSDLQPILDHLGDITGLITSYLEETRETKRVDHDAQRRHFAHQRRIVYTAAGTFLAVVLIAAGMTAQGALSGDAFTFVLGTLFGAILTFLQTMLRE
ncbi:hypothetical protein [Natronobiforma cellulositropha]|uniref:hypothetical protein n=1 Tax=Natronobiforma cellulositropha TaxID=1679076 RepID=UPI0021D60F45|nr:hypothetical protein [Natronobiforma cellulositropha]